MGKSKGGSSSSNKKGGKGGGSASVSVPKCVCDHPYNCSCGNRPPRPSKGHKWDPETQQWGGKGHKQKGASGQVASKGQEATQTQVGKTTVAQWQKLPSFLLDDFCKHERRPRPKYKSLDTKKQGSFKYRVICQPAKGGGGDNDLILVPSQPCQNEEQAREEAALLALLHLTPNLPHERKLPEPYKTTWLHAIQSKQQLQQRDDAKKPAKKQPPRSTSNNDASGDNNNDDNNNNNNAAKASTNLTRGNAFVSLADKRRQVEVRRQARNARIRKHEAIRMANRDHPVFLSAQKRKQIEGLLRGEAIQWQEEGDEEVADDDDDENDLAAYVVSRLRNEGFTTSQAKTTISQTNNNKKIDEDKWDAVYDECLQWLCIHLDEDQLPEGFDPRGKTLDLVVVAPTETKKPNAGPKAQYLASRYGLTVAEAAHLLSGPSSDTTEKRFWDKLVAVSNSQLTKQPPSDNDQTANQEIAQEELEALEAIFPLEECTVQRTQGTVTVSIALPPSSEQEALKLIIVMRDGYYPAIHPEQVLLQGQWPQSVGTAVHVELVRFVASLPLSEPMAYELYGKAQSLLQEASDGQLTPTSLVAATKERPKRKQPTTKPTVAPVTKKLRRRPRQLSPFWSLPPKKTPPAVAFPRIPNSLKSIRQSLPAAKAREEFLSIMKKADKGGRVVLVTGDTGCGKTTQIPQFILEQWPEEAKIVVAQPRRLAATGVAARVAKERGESQAGTGSVGHVVRGDTALCKSSRLVFCTTGVLLRQLQSEGPLDCLTHVIVDEVHERHVDTDVLLGVLKDCLRTTPHLRVVLMSATLDADRFATYWGRNTPRMHIPGRTFPVSDHLLEDVLALLDYVPPKKKKKKQQQQYAPRKRTPWADSERSDNEEDESIGTDTTVSGGTNPQGSSGICHNWEEVATRVDETNVDYNMLGQLVKYLVHNKQDDGSILVFLAGVEQINGAIQTIEKITRGMSVQLLPLHGSLQPKDQNRVFLPASPGCTKVILSTNVAETSVTIPDCTVVIDSCREKQSSYDPVNRMPLLLERFASVASLKQRRGRAGRVREGTCYKLISRATLRKLPEHGTPEIHRCALDQTLLSLMFLGVETGCGNFLRTLLDPPTQESLEAAIASLQKLGAVAPRGEGGNTRLTPLGMHLAGIPAPPTVGKMLVMGSVLGCRSAALAMAAGMSVGKSPFLRIDSRKRPNNDDEETVEDMKRNKTLQERADLFKQVGNSDHALLAAVYLRWDSCGSGGGERKRFCDILGLHFNGMRDMKQLVRQFDSSLAAVGYGPSEEADRNSKSWRIIRACAVASMAPGQLVRVQRPRTKYAETAEGAIEKDGQARELKFYIQARAANEQDGGVYRGYHGMAEERVFVHPSSSNFSTGSYGCPWLVYHELVRTSKPFLRDATECSAYALLLFGGNLEVQAANGLIVVEDWVRLSANARIGALIGGLRKKIDHLLTKKVEDPIFDICATIEMRLIRSLLVTDGLGQ